MNINTDINILGGLPDIGLIKAFFMSEDIIDLTNFDQSPRPLRSNTKRLEIFTKIKTHKSIIRFEKAIKSTLLYTANENISQLISSMINKEDISADATTLLFWNASFNNELLHYLNKKVYFPAYYSGRFTIKREEVIACLNELKQIESSMKDWTESTIRITSSKYLTLLKKFNLMEGSKNKSIVHPYLSDKMLIVYTYWLLAIESKANLFNSEWLAYSFLERSLLLERIMQIRFSKFININYVADYLKIERVLSYKEIYNAIINT